MKPRLGWSLRTRLVAGFSVISTLLIVSVSFVIYAAMTRQLIDVVDTALDDRMVDIVRDVGRDDLDVVGDDRLTQLLDTNGVPLVSSPSVPVGIPLIDDVEIEVIRTEGPIRVTRRIDGLDHRIRVLVVVAEGPEGDRVVAAARSLEAVDRNRRELLVGLVVSAPLMAVVISAFGWAFARRILRPVQHMASRAEALEADDARIDVGAVPGRDEFKGLAESFNRLLSRISDVRHNEQRFIADVSHELRTPLAVLRGELELASSEPDLDADLRASLVSAIEEIDRMTQLVSRLLMMARADARQIVPDPSPTNMRSLVEGLVEGLPSAEPGKIAIDASRCETNTVLVDANVTTQILLNLLNNAVRHAHANVAIASRIDGRTLRIEVSDDGNGFDDPASALNRFSRGGRLRDTDAGETRFGLGLAIVHALAEAYGGDVSVRNAGTLHGATVVVRLPVGSAVRPPG